MNAQKWKFFHKLFDAKRWMDGKLINVADQIRAWQTDFFCKINRGGATFIRYLRVNKYFSEFSFLRKNINATNLSTPDSNSKNATNSMLLYFIFSK